MQVLRGELVFPRKAQLLTKSPWRGKGWVKAGAVDITGVHDAGKTQDPRVCIDIKGVPYQKDLATRPKDSVEFCTCLVDVDPMPGLRAGEGIKGGAGERCVLGGGPPSRHPEPAQNTRHVGGWIAGVDDGIG